MKRSSIKSIGLVLGLFLSTASMAADSGSSWNNGTELYAKFSINELSCIDSDYASVSFFSALGTTGSVAPTRAFGYLNGEGPFLIGQINPQDFIHNGRWKVAELKLKEKFKKGEYKAYVCYEQNGSKGNPRKEVCSDTTYFKVSCANSCSGNLDGKWVSCQDKDIGSVKTTILAESGSLTVYREDYDQSGCTGTVIDKNKIYGTYSMTKLETTNLFLIAINSKPELVGCESGTAYSQLEFGERCDKFRTSRPSCDSSKLNPIDNKSPAFYKSSPSPSPSPSP